MEKGADGSETITFEMGTGNVYADLGYSDPEAMAAKASLVRQIRAAMEDQGLSQAEAAKAMGMDQPTLSKLLRGIVRNVTLDRLSLMLRRLGQNVIILVEPGLPAHPDSPRLGHVEVRGAPVALIS